MSGPTWEREEKVVTNATEKWKELLRTAVFWGFSGGWPVDECKKEKVDT